MDNPPANGEYQFEALRKILRELQSGQSADQVMEQVRAIYDGEGAVGMLHFPGPSIDGLPIDVVQRLCDIHSVLFRESGAQAAAPDNPTVIPGHPIHTLRSENRAVEALLDEQIEPGLQDLAAGRKKAAQILRRDLDQLAEIGIHYRKKEELLFPRLLRYGVNRPPKVMAGMDREILSLIEAASAALGEGKSELAPSLIQEILNRVREMIFKEDNILYPMALEILSTQDWRDIAAESSRYGNCLIVAVPEWTPDPADAVEPETGRERSLVIPSGGSLTLRQISGILESLPLSVAFVDDGGIVRYVCRGGEPVSCHNRIIVGRRFTDCHPPAGIPVVEKILSGFKSGAGNREVFRISVGPRHLLVRYIAVRSKDGEYLGALEVTQDIESLRSLLGDDLRAMDQP